MRALFIAVGLALGSYGGALADTMSDCLQEKDQDLGIRSCTAAIQSGMWSGKGLSWAYVNRGNAYGRKKDYDHAIANYDQAISLDPTLALAYYSRGSVYGGKEDYDRAIADYDQAIRLDPKLALAYN